MMHNKACSKYPLEISSLGPWGPRDLWLFIQILEALANLSPLQSSGKIFRYITPEVVSLGS
jgi:hypothetical protein